MRDCGKARAAILAAVFLGVPGTAPSWGQEAGETLAVRIHDYASLPAETVAAAAAEAARLLRRAGIDMKWTLCPAPPPKPPACADPLGAGELKLEILSRKHAAPVASSSVLGYAVLPRDGSPGVLAGILYDRIERQIPQTLASLPQILGHVAAHEIGHLLLGSNGHAASGLMAAQILGRDFDRAAQGALRFSPDEAERLRAGALSRRAHGGTSAPERVRTADAR